MNNALNQHFIQPFSFPFSLIPQDIKLFSCDYFLSNYQYSLFETYNILCPDTIQRAVAKRQAEYLTGRYCAVQSLTLLNIAVVDIAIGKHRNPVWPEGVCGSITHTHNKGVAVCAFNQNYQYLGIDLENKLPLKTIHDIKSSIVNKAEEKVLMQSDLVFEDAFTLVFSAKEALFKALYPSVGAYFDFSAAEVIDICYHTNTIHLKLQENLTSDLIIGRVFIGYFSLMENTVFSIIYL